jgi:hypothetical protein
MKILGWVLVGVSTLSSSAAFAKAADYCTPVAKLTKQLSSCSDNEILFGDAAVACLNKFEKDADLQSNDLQNMMMVSAKEANAGQSQQEYLDTTEKNYLATEVKLSALLVSGQRALQQVAEYRANLAMPEDFESAENMGFSTDEFLKSIPCFEENRALLVDVGKDILQKTKELKEARDIAAAQAKVTATAKANISNGTLPGNKIVTGTQQGPSIGIVKSGTPSNGASDITGTDRKPAQIDP